MGIEESFGKMSDRELLLLLVGEVRCIGANLAGHLTYHSEQNKTRDDRRWKLCLGLLLTAITVTGVLLTAILV